MRELKLIKVRIILPEGHATQKVDFHAPPGRHYDDGSEAQAIEKVIDYLDEKYLYWNFRMVRVGRGQYNFVYDGIREDSDAYKSVHRQEQDRDASEVPSAEVAGVPRSGDGGDERA